MHCSILSTKSFEYVDATFTVHELEASDEVKSSVLSFLVVELLGVQVTDIIKA